MIWLGSFLLILSYIVLGRKNMRLGWMFSLLGNGEYIFALWFRYHTLDVCVVPVVFTLLSAYNLWKELNL